MSAEVEQHEASRASRYATDSIDVFKDISLSQVCSALAPRRRTRADFIPPTQWLALTPPELVKAHLQLSDETISQLSKEKPVIVAAQG